MTANEAFERILQRDNKVFFDPEQIDPEPDSIWFLEKEDLIGLKAEYNRFFDAAKANAKKDMVDIHLGFVNSPVINAFAEEHVGDNAFIGINRGCYHVLRFVFARMLANKNILRSVGNPDDERGDIVPLPELSSNFSSILEKNENINGVTEYFWPNDERRGQYCRLLLDIAMDFIIVHEYAHIRNGHCAYLDDQLINTLCNGPGYRLDESVLMRYSAGSKSGKAYEEQLLFQSFELDADSAAASTSMRKLCMQIIDAHTVRSEWRWVYADPKLAFFTWQFAVGTMITLFGLEWPDITDSTGESHPPGAFRFANVFSVGHEFLKRERGINPEWADIYLETASQVIAALTEAFTHTAVKPIESGAEEGLGQAFGDSGNSYLDMLRQQWSTKTRDLVKDFARDELAS